MPIIKSAKKRVKVTNKKTVLNVKTKKSLRSSLKAFHAAITGGSKVDESRRAAQSALDKAAKKGVMSKNKASRKKKQLSKAAKSAGSAPAKTVKAKPAAKKASTKPAAKKTVAKKPAAKKTAKK